LWRPAPGALALDGAGNLFVADDTRIRKVAPDGSTTTLAGGGNGGFADGTGGANGTARFSEPAGLAVDGAGNVYVADALNYRIRKIASDGTTTTLAGSGPGPGVVDGPGGVAIFFQPRGVAVDDAGNVYVADTGNYLIRRVAPDGFTTRVAGDGNWGFVDGPGCGARFVDLLAAALAGKRLIVGEVALNRGDIVGSRVRQLMLP
jgi:hypothetical protein